MADQFGGWTCQVEQGHYGHRARKATWLYAVGTARPELIWGAGEQRLDEMLLRKVGYVKARRCGAIGSVGGKYKAAIRAATPPEFRDLLLLIAGTATRSRRAAE